MEKPQPFRLVRDALGFYSQVPIETPDVEVAHAGVEAADKVVDKVADISTAKRRMGRPPKKKTLNAEFEVDV